MFAAGSTGWRRLLTRTPPRTETAISDLRRRRIAIDERLAQGRAATGDAWQKQRKRITAARDDLEHNAAELSKRLS
jgi:hypothetical protein